MAGKRFLLVTTALSAAAYAGCGKERAGGRGDPRGDGTEVVTPLPGNPKGSAYDESVEPPPPLLDAGEEATPPVPPDAAVIPRLPANPKGTHYDAGLKKKPGEPGAP